jgi:hypothetical protein
MVATDAHAAMGEVLVVAFSVRSVPRLYNEEQLRLRESLETTMGRVGGWFEVVASLGVSWRNELVVRQLSASKDVNTEAEEATALEAVTRRQPMKIQQTEKISNMLYLIV